MSGRYLIRCVDVGVEVYDSTTGNHDAAAAVFGPASYETASRVAADMNLREPQKAAAPSCDCARYRAALEQIARHAGERHVLRLANDALDCTGERP